MIAGILALVSFVSLSPQAQAYSNSMTCTYRTSYSDTIFYNNFLYQFNYTIYLDIRIDFSSPYEYQCLLYRTTSDLVIYDDDDDVYSYLDNQHTFTTPIEITLNGEATITGVYDSSYSEVSFQYDGTEIALFEATDVTFTLDYSIINQLDISYYQFYTRDVGMLIDQYYGNTYDSGYEAGYDEGWNTGYDYGYEAGQDLGYSFGYEEGYYDGSAEGGEPAVIFSGILAVALLPVNFFLQVLNFEVFGVNIGGFVTGLLTLAIIIIIIRLITGKGASVK